MGGGRTGSVNAREAWGLVAPLAVELGPFPAAQAQLAELRTAAAEFATRAQEIAVELRQRFAASQRAIERSHKLLDRISERELADQERERMAREGGARRQQPNS